MLLMYKMKKDEEWKVMKKGDRKESFERMEIMKACCPEFDFKVEYEEGEPVE